MVVEPCWMEEPITKTGWEDGPDVTIEDPARVDWSQEQGGCNLEQ